MARLLDRGPITMQRSDDGLAVDDFSLTAA
jgi:hypothetical protein